MESLTIYFHQKPAVARTVKDWKITEFRLLFSRVRIMTCPTLDPKACTDPDLPKEFFKKRKYTETVEESYDLRDIRHIIVTDTENPNEGRIWSNGVWKNFRFSQDDCTGQSNPSPLTVH